MTRRRTLLRSTADFLSLFGAAGAAAQAAEQSSTPKARDLEILGIAPADFRAIRR